jgi:hypothetical protein
MGISQIETAGQAAMLIRVTWQISALKRHKKKTSDVDRIILRLYEIKRLIQDNDIKAGMSEIAKITYEIDKMFPFEAPKKDSH